MTAEELIASGKLELYVCGALPSEEISEIEALIASHPEVKSEVEAIEASLMSLATAVSPPFPALVWTYVLNAIRKVRTLDDRKTTNWFAITGWAAAILFAGGILWLLQQNNNLKENIEITTTENNILKENNQVMVGHLAETKVILDIIRSKDYSSIILPGNQAVAPNAFAKVYYNKTDKVAYFDSQGLPVPPSGKVYQVWSLKMDPLTPSSLGLLGAISDTDKGVFRFEGIPDPEAFGITLEPEGGSESPTLSQLYTLGMVSP